MQRRVDLSADTIVSKKHAVFISTHKSARRCSPEEQQQLRHLHRRKIFLRRLRCKANARLQFADRLQKRSESEYENPQFWY